MAHRYRLLYTKQEIAVLHGSTVALCGVGCGSMLVDPLARYELNELRLADPDRYQPTNMDRQILARFSTLGQLKVNVAASLARDVTMKTRVVIYPRGVTARNVMLFCAGAKAVIDLCDRLSARLLLHATCERLRIPIVTGGNRACSERIGLKVEVFRYDHGLTLASHFDHKNWGLSEETWRTFLREYEAGSVRTATSEKIDRENKTFRKRHAPSTFGSTEKLHGKARGGYDPLKIIAMAGGILQELLTILVDRAPQHHAVHVLTHTRP